MARKNGRQRSPEEAARREKIRELLALSGVEGMEDIQQLFRETVAEFMESGLDAEMDEQLGYDRYDVKGKETDDSRNGHSRKTLRMEGGQPFSAVHHKESSFLMKRQWMMASYLPWKLPRITPRRFTPL